MNQLINKIYLSVPFYHHCPNSFSIYLLSSEITIFSGFLQFTSCTGFAFTIYFSSIPLLLRLFYGLFFLESAFAGSRDFGS